MTAVSVEDAIAVYDLFGRYCYFVDHNKGEEWADLYTDDGVADGILPEPVVGREQLARVAPDSFERFAGKVGHQFTNPMMDYGASKDEIVVKASGLVTFWDNGGSLFCFAYYDIKLVRIDGAWKIKRNDVRLMT